MKRFSKAALFVVFGLVLSNCGGGSSGSTGNLKTGFFAADSSMKDATYPLVVVKVSSNSTATYQLSSLTGFGSGESVDNGNVDHSTTDVYVVGGGGISGFITLNGANLHMQVVQSASPVDTAADVAKGKIIQDYAMKPIDQNAALAIVRSNVTLVSSGTFSAKDEAACQGAFTLSCSALYTAPAATP